MIQTLALIDKDYYQQFGWKQASLWAIEEPESSMHTTLEAQVVSFLAQLSTESDGRLQIIGTTHSDLMLQSSDTIVMNLPDEVLAMMPEVEWGKAIGLRNIIAHAYFGVSDQILWDVVQNKIPVLKQTVDRLMMSLDKQ